MEVKCLVVDDDVYIRNYLTLILQALEGVTVVGETGEGEDALKLAIEQQPNVIFLDINIPGITGLELSEKLLSFKNPPCIVFVTAYSEKAVQAFELDAIDFLVKPFDEERVIRAINKVKDKIIKGILLN